MAEIIGDLINDVQSRYSKGVQSTSNRLSNRMVYHNLQALRATLISQKANKKEHFADSFYQLLEGVEMQIVRSSMLSTLQIGKPLMGSKTKLPSIICSNDIPLISSVSNIDNSKVYNRVTWQTLKNSSGRKFTGNNPNYILLEDYLYINLANTPQVIAVRAIFNDPILAGIYPVYDSCGSSPNCTSYLDMSFYTDKDMANIIVEMVSEKLIKQYAERTEDRIQDAVDNTK